MTPRRDPWHEHDPLAVMLAGAALQLVPENADLLIPLQRLVAFAGAVTGAQESRPLSTSALKRLYATAEVSDPHALAQIDQFESALVAETAICGEVFLVRQGIVGNAHDLARSADALEMLSQESPSDIALRAALDVAKGLIWLSDEISRRAGETRTRFPPAERNRSLVIPGKGRLAELVEALSFDVLALEAALGPRTVKRLQQFAFPREALDASVLGDVEAITDEFVRHPLLFDGARLLVIGPVELAATASRLLQDSAIERGLESEYGYTLNVVALDDAETSVRLLAASPLGPPVASRIPQVTFHRYAFAGGKRLDIALIVDTLEGRRQGEITGYWPTSECVDFALELVDSDGVVVDADHDTLRLVVLASCGRYAAYGVGELNRPGPLLICNLEELRWVALAFADDPLRLWRYALAHNRVSESASIFSFGFLDTLGLYLDHRDSFYLGDGERPDLIVPAPGDGVAIRRNLTELFGNFPVRDPASGRIALALSARNGSGLPIYRLLGSATPHIMLARLPEVDLWVDGTAAIFEADDFVSHVIDAVAYWAWQIERANPGIWRKAVGRAGAALVEIQVDDEGRLLAAMGEVPPDEAIPNARWIISQTADGRIRMPHWLLTVKVAHLRRLTDHSESADGDICDALWRIVDPTADADRQVVQDLVGAGANPYLFVRNIASTLDFQPTRMSRPITAHMQGEMADLVGEIAHAKLGSRRRVARADGVALLNHVVAELFARFEQVVGGLSSDGLLAELVARDEALLHDGRTYFIESEQRQHFFGERWADEAGDFAERSNRISKSARASRFVVEYVSAVPPAGASQVSDDTYDRLLALSGEIAELGFRSDAINFGLSDVDLVLLPSGRLNLGAPDGYQRAVERQNRIIIEDAYSDHLDGRASPSPGVFDKPVGDALAHEVGVTLAELTTAMGALVGACVDGGGTPVVGLSRGDVLQLFVTLPGYDLEKAECALSALELAELENFLAEPSAVVPWRYGRSRSYLRRPVATSGTGDDRICTWGPERVVSAAHFWSDSLRSGRFQAQSAPLRTALGSVRRAASGAFEQQVAARLGALGADSVASGLRKLCGSRILDVSGNDLGDIDALGLWTREKVIVVAEAKDFELDRLPSETRAKAHELVHRENSVRERHERRVKWISGHIALVLKHFGVPPSGGWKVMPVIVTSRPLALLADERSLVPILHLDDLDAWVRRVMRSRGQQGVRHEL